MTKTRGLRRQSGRWESRWIRRRDSLRGRGGSPKLRDADKPPKLIHVRFVSGSRSLDLRHEPMEMATRLAFVAESATRAKALEAKQACVGSIEGKCSREEICGSTMVTFERAVVDGDFSRLVAHPIRLNESSIELWRCLRLRALKPIQVRDWATRPDSHLAMLCDASAVRHSLSASRPGCPRR
jgi:hypothetical protein